MKTKLFPLLFLLMTLNSYSQTPASLSTAAQKLFTAHYEMDFETIVALSYPKMVENMGKDKMVEQLDLCYQNEAYRLRYQLEKVPLVYHKVQKIGNQSFCVITCRNPVRYFFETKLTPEEAAAKISVLQESNHTKEVVFEPNRNSFNVKRNTTFLAIADDSTNGTWQFINWDDPNQQEVFRTLFDEKIKTALGLQK